VADRVDSMARMLPNGLKGKLEHYTGTGVTSNNFGYAIDQIDRNLGDVYNISESRWVCESN
jgi:hypothetical protein